MDTEAFRLVEEERAALRSALDCLLPPNKELPGAGSMGLADRVEREAADVQPHSVALRQVLQALPPGFVLFDGRSQDQALREVESAYPASFGVLVLLAYNAYYTDQRVLRLIEREFGYEARPPQPLGYQLKPFDESLLAKQKQRAPFWRTVGDQPPASSRTQVDRPRTALAPDRWTTDD